MHIQYPLFILEKDDLSMRIILEPKDLNWYEKIDIDEGLYNGWDIKGYPFNLVWDESQSSPKIEITREHPEIDQLCNAIKDYARRYRPKVSFDYSGSNVIDLFKAAEEHINQGRLSCRITKKLKSLWKK